MRKPSRRSHELAAQAKRSFEFQRLHGMGEELYAQIVGADKLGLPCRVYAPVGSHEDLLPYLVRRLLENGANTSFVNRIVDEQTAIDDIVRDPVAEVDALQQKAHPRIPLPRMLYGSSRLNSRGVNLADPFEYDPFAAGVVRAARERWTGGADRLRASCARVARQRLAILRIATRSSAR